MTTKNRKMPGTQEPRKRFRRSWILGFLAALVVAEPARGQDAATKGIEVLTDRGETRGDAASGFEDLLKAISDDPGSPSALLASEAVSRYMDLVPDGRATLKKAIQKALEDKDLSGWAREKYAMVLVDLRLACGEKDGLAEETAKRGYLRHWLAVGPFGRSGRSILDEVFAPEVDLRAAAFDPKTRYETTKGPQAWSRVPFRPLLAGVDFTRALRATSGACYLVTHVESDADCDVVFSYEGSSAKIFVNRALAGLVDRHHHRLDGRVRFAAKLKKGWNRIAVKTGEWSSFFQLRLSSMKGELLPGVKEDDRLQGHEVPAESDSSGDVKPSWVLTQLAKADTPEKKALYAYALLQFGLGEEGLAVLDDPKVNGPLASKPWFMALRGEACERADNLTEPERRDKAVKAYKAALKADEHYVSVRRRLAEFDLADEKTKEGLSRFEKILEERPDDLATRVRFFNALFDKGYEHDAETVLLDLEKRLPGSITVIGARARWAEAKGDRVSLQKIFERELAVDKRALWVYEKRRELALANGDTDGARAALEAELAGSWELEDGEADLRRAGLARQLGDKVGELKLLEKALEARPEDLNLREQVARGYAERADEAATKRALALLDDLLEVEPARVAAQNLRTALRAKKDEFWKEWEYDAKDLIAGSPTAEKYGNAATVCLWDQTVTRIRRDGSATEVIHQTWKILDEDGIEPMGKRQMHGDVMAVRVYTPVGEILEPIRAGNSFEMPGLAPNAVVEHEFKLEHPAPELHYTNGPWYLQDPELKEPFVHSRWIVIAPKDMNLEVIEKNLEAAHCKKTVETRGDEVVRIWETFEQPRIEPEPLMPPKEEFLPWVKLYERRTLEELAGSYRDQALGRAYVTPSIQAKADEIAGKLEGNTQKIEAIYHFVKEHVRTPEGGETASQILAAKGGNQTVLMAALLEAAKVPFKWAFPGPSPDSDYSTDWEHPEPWQFNPVRPLLLVAPRDGTPKWINVQGARYAPMDLLGPGLWGAPVFVCDGASGTLEVLPRGNPADTGRVSRLKVELQEKGAVKATFQSESRNPGAYGFKEDFKNASKKQIENYAAKIANQLFTGAKLVNWSTPKLEDPNVPFSFEINLAAKDVVRKIADGSLTLPPIIQPLDLKRGFGGKATRKYDLVLTSWIATRDEVTLDLGPYAAPRLPSDVQAESRFGQYSLVYVREGARLRIERSLTFFPKRVSPSEYKSFLGFIDKVDAAERRPIVVEPTGKKKANEEEDK